MDYTALADAADWTAALTGLGAVAVAVAGVYVAIRGGRILLSFIRK